MLNVNPKGSINISNWYKNANNLDETKGSKIIKSIIQDTEASDYANVWNQPELLFAGQDKFGNNRGYCKLCKVKCPSYMQIGWDDLRCVRCSCGASAHMWLPLDKNDVNAFSASLSNDILPKLNQNITQEGINFNSFLAMYKIMDKNANANQFSWLYQLLREAGFTIWFTEIKQWRNDKLNETSTKLNKLKGNWNNFYGETNKFNDTIYVNKSDINHTKCTCKKDTTFHSLAKVENRLKLMSYNNMTNTQNFNKSLQHLNNIQHNENLRGSSLYKTIININQHGTYNQSMEIKQKYYDEFVNPVLIICLGIPIPNNINYFEKFNYALNNSNKMMKNLSNTIKLIYYSKNKINAWWDVQVMFPELFEVNKKFVFVQPKVRKEGQFNRYLSIYKDGLFSNSVNLINIKQYDRLSQLAQETESKIKHIELNVKIGDTLHDLLTTYLQEANPKKINNPCAILEISSIGWDSEISQMANTLAYNPNWNIISYDDEEECDELNTFFFQTSTYGNSHMNSSYERALIIFRPFLLRTGWNEVILNIFRLNKFNILTRQKKILNQTELLYLYSHEFPKNSASIQFEEYARWMSDTKCEIVVLSKFSAVDDIRTIIGFNKEEVNVNLFNTIQSNLANSNMKIEYEISNKLFSNELINIPKDKLIEYFKPGSGAKSSDKWCFRDISTLLNIQEIMSAIAKEKQAWDYNDLFILLQEIKTNLLKFTSFFNIFTYSNCDRKTNEEEVNFMCPRWGNIEEVLLFVNNFQKNQETLKAMKYEILEVKPYQLNEEEFDRLFLDFLKYNYITERDYLSSKQYYLNNRVSLVRVVKPGGFYEMQKIVGKQNYLFLQLELRKELELLKKKSSVLLENDNGTKVDIIQIWKENMFMLNFSIDIEYFYIKWNENIFKIEGKYWQNESFAKRNILPEILQSCLKCTVGENIRRETNLSTNNGSLIERYIYFYHFDYQEKEEEYFLTSWIRYIFPRYSKPDPASNYQESKFFEYIRYANDKSNRLNPQISFFTESTNLGFYEIRIPVFEFSTTNGWTYFNMLDYWLCKTYLYTDNNFYNQLVAKNTNRTIYSILPYEKGSLNKYFNLELTNALIMNTNKMTYNIEEFMPLNCNLNNSMNFNENDLEILRRIFYMTKYESTKMFYKMCINTNPKNHIVPKNYHYRIKPNDIYMNINRIYEVESFGGLFFIEKVVQDFMKHRLHERGEKFINGVLTKYSTPHLDYYPDNNFQFSLPSYLWGRKLFEICKIVEDTESCPVEGYGPWSYFPKEEKLNGWINSDYIIEYELYWYVNILDDMKTCDINFFSEEEFEWLEKKLFEVFESEIFTTTRVKENIRLVPCRLTESNLRITKNSSVDINTETGAIDPKSEKQFHHIFKNHEKDEENLLKTSQIIKSKLNEAQGETWQVNSWLNDENFGSMYESTVNEFKTDLKNSQLTLRKKEYPKKNEQINKEGLSKNVYLIDLFCHCGMKYHTYASIWYLIKVYYKKLSRKTELLSIPTFKDYPLDIESEYDKMLEALLEGFCSNSPINYAAFNDIQRYNAYNIEYFFYCLKEIKYVLNEITLLRDKLLSFDDVMTNKSERDSDFIEMKSIYNEIKTWIDKYSLNWKIIFKEALECKLRQSEDDLSNEKRVYVPRERYHIPMYMPEKWERDLNNEKYMKVVKVKHNFLKNLDTLKDKNERELFSSSGFRVANDHYYIKKSLLRQPEPEISDKIWIKTKRKDKTNLEGKLFSNLWKNQTNNFQTTGIEKQNETVKINEKTIEDYLNMYNKNDY